MISPFPKYNANLRDLCPADNHNNKVDRSTQRLWQLYRDIKVPCHHNKLGYSASFYHRVPTVSLDCLVSVVAEKCTEKSIDLAGGHWVSLVVAGDGWWSVDVNTTQQSASPGVC